MKALAGFIILSLLASCAIPYGTRDGKISLLNTADKNSFSFSVSDEFARDNADSPKDKRNSMMSKAESGLLVYLLKTKQYCTKSGRNPKFVITSQQEKIYDATYAHLIEKSYNAKSIMPKTYFGHCQEKK
jgi:hypothetical protein